MRRPRCRRPEDSRPWLPAQPASRTLRARMQSRKPGAKRSICASMRSAIRARSVVSKFVPLGTWQYAHSTCLPAGARVGSKSVGWATSTKGRSAQRPRATAYSEAAISSNVPPRCTVIARRHSLRSPRDRIRKCVVDLECTWPWLESLACAPVVVANPVAGNGQQLPWRGVEEYQIALRFELFERRRIDAVRSVHRAAQRIEIAGERLRNGVRAAARNGPTHRMNRDAEHQSDGRAQRLVEAQARVPCQARKHCARAGVRKMALSRIQIIFVNIANDPDVSKIGNGKRIR